MSWRVVSASLVAALLLLPIFLPDLVMAQDNYNFGSESVVKGFSTNPSNRNAEDTQYETLTEADQYTNTNFSASSENVVTGTGGGSSFPSALDTDDSNRRSYTEANTAPSSYILYLLPDGDSSVNWDTVYPASPTTHYTKVNERTTGSDSDTSYVDTATASDRDVFTVQDMSAPAGSPTSIDVRIFSWAKKTSGSTANLQFGIVSGGSDYSAYSGNPSTSYVNRSKGWLVDPKDSVEWTSTKVNALTIYITTSDASPTVRFSQIGLQVYVNYSVNYNLDAQITYSSVTNSSWQTLSWSMYCQGYRSSSENFYVYAWNYVSSAWDLKTTIQAASDTDYDFTLTTNQRSAASNEVKVRIVDGTADDGTQDIVYFDVLKVTRIEVGYALDVELTASSLPSYGDLWLRIKAYTSTETFNIKMYNWGGSSWSATVLSVTALSNTWYEYNYTEATYLSGGQTKIQITDGTDQTTDTTQDVLYLDVAWVSHYHQNPSLSQDGCDPTPTYKGTTIHFFVIVTDSDNELPSAGYPKLKIEATSYTMTENSSGDTTTYDGKAYYYDKSDSTQGIWHYNFITKDANSVEISTAQKTYTITNRAPYFTSEPVTPQNYLRNTLWEFDLNASDDDGDTLTYSKVGATPTWITVNPSSGMASGTSPDATGLHTFNYKVVDGNGSEDTGSCEITIYNRDPVITSSGNTTQDYHTFMSYQAIANDPDGDTVTWAFSSNATFLSLSSNYVNGTVEAGYWHCMLWANDSYGGSDSEEWYLTVNEPPANNPPTLTTFDRHPADPVYITTEVTFHLNYSDSENEPPVYIKWREDGGATQNLTMSEIDAGDTNYVDGKAYGISIYLAHGLHNYDFATSDGTTAVSGGSNSITIANRNPSISNKLVEVEQWRNTYWEYDYEATDADTDTITWYHWDDDGLSIGSSTGLINGTTPDAVGTYTVNVWANDSYGGSDFDTFDLEISNRQPSILSSGNSSQFHGTYHSYHVIASDADSDTLTIEYQTNSTLGLDGWYINGTCSAVGTFWNKIWVNDSYGGSDYDTWDLLVVENQAPYFTNTPDNETYNNSAYSWLPIAIDPDSAPDSLSFSLSTNASWLQINTTTGRVNGTPNKIGSYFVNITVFDGETSISLNYTLDVMSEPTTDIIVLGIGLLFAFAFLVIGLKYKQYMVISGVVWIAAALTIFMDYGNLFLITGLGVGMLQLIGGGWKLAG